VRSEFELIDDFVRRFGRARGELLLGAGDDAALLRPGRGEELVLTVDALVEGVHFTRDFTPEEVGHKALAVNLSDLAAMGARPVAFLCALAFPPGWTPKLPGIARGMSKLARGCGVQLAGGNMTRARQLSITITAIGAVPRGQALQRDGARVGDLLVVSGELGGAAAGLGRSASPQVRRRQRRPTPRLGLGMAARGLAHAAIDISDGLAADLGHLLGASGVGAHLQPEQIPIAPGAALKDALTGGEDYELLLAVPPRKLPALARLAGCPLTQIGAVVRGRGISGLPGKLPRGFQHFR